MPEWFWAGFWGLVAGSALLVGAGVGDLVELGKRSIASVMAFGSGVLISALSFDLMADAYRRGGFDSTSAGFLGGAVIYSLANWLLSRKWRQASKTVRGAATVGTGAARERTRHCDRRLAGRHSRVNGHWHQPTGRTRRQSCCSHSYFHFQHSGRPLKFSWYEESGPLTRLRFWPLGCHHRDLRASCLIGLRCLPRHIGRIHRGDYGTGCRGHAGNAG